MQAISVATLKINSVTIPYQANTLTFTDGLGSVIVGAQVVGANTVTNVYARDLSEAVSGINFSLANTPELINFIKEWRNNFNNNLIELIGNSSTLFNAIFQQAVIAEVPEIPLGADTQIDLVWKSDLAIFG